MLNHYKLALTDIICSNPRGTLHSTRGLMPLAKNSCDKPQRRSATSFPRPRDDKWTRWSCPKAVFIRWSIGNHLWLVVDLPL